MNLGPVATLPQDRGFKASIWSALDPHSRLLLLQEILVSRPDLRLDGSVDHTRSLEPLFTDRQGRLVSIAGERVDKPTTGLVVDITKGTIIEPDNRLILLATIAVIVVAVIVTVR